MRVIPTPARAGITGFEPPAAEYTQLGLSLDELLVDHPSSTFMAYALGDSMQDVDILMVIFSLLTATRLCEMATSL